MHIPIKFTSGRREAPHLVPLFDKKDATVPQSLTAAELREGIQAIDVEAFHSGLVSLVGKLQEPLSGYFKSVSSREDERIDWHMRRKGRTLFSADEELRREEFQQTLSFGQAVVKKDIPVIKAVLGQQALKDEAEYQEPLNKARGKLEEKLDDDDRYYRLQEAIDEGEIHLQDPALASGHKWIAERVEDLTVQQNQTLRVRKRKEIEEIEGKILRLREIQRLTLVGK